MSGLQSVNFGGTEGVTDDPRSVVYRATILGFGGGCSYEDDEVLVRLFVDISAVPGPAYDGREMSFPYFIAVQDPGGAVIDKQVFNVTLPRPLQREAVGTSDTIDQRLANVGVADGPQWRIYLGLDLPPEAALRREREDQASPPAPIQSGTRTRPSGPAATRP